MWGKLLSVSFQAINCRNPRTWRYIINNVNVCLPAWGIINGWNSSRIYEYAKKISNGQRRPYIKLTMTSAVAGEDNAPKTQNIIAWLDRYANEMGHFLPTSDDSGNDNVVHLPFSIKSHVWCEYNHAHKETPRWKCSRQHFLRVWSKRRNTIKKRRVANNQMAMCDKCEGYKRALRASANNQENDEIYQRYRGHILLQGLERATYYKRREMAISQPKLYLSVIIDGMAQKKLNIPRLKVSLKSKFAMKQVNQCLYGVHFHGHVSYMVMSDHTVAGGANFTCQVMYESLCRLRTDVPMYREQLPRTLFLQVDNASKETKNKAVTAYCAALVEAGVFDTIIVSYLLKGHTHEDIDQIFSVVSEKLQSIDILWFDEFDEAVAAAFGENANNPHVVACKTYRIYGCHDFTYLFLGKRPPIDGIMYSESDTTLLPSMLDKNFGGHSRPHSFIFEVSFEDGRRVCKLRYRNFSASEKWSPQPLVSTEQSQDEIEQEAIEVHTRMAGASQQERARDIEIGGASESAEGTQTVVRTTAVSMTPAETAERLSLQVINGRQHFRYETQRSLASYATSPGIPLLVRQVDWDNLTIAYPKCREAATSNIILHDIQSFLKVEAVLQTRSEEQLTDLSNRWNSYFEQLPKSVDDIKDKIRPFYIELLLPQSDEVLSANLINITTARELVQLEEDCDGDEVEAISYSGRSSNMLSTERRIRDERKEAVNMVPVPRNSFVLVVNDEDSMCEVTGVSEEERLCPVMLARVVVATDTTDPEELVLVEWWRQRSGNLNGTFRKAIQSGSGAKPWQQHIQRGTIIIVDAQLTKSKALKAGTKKKLIEIGHPCMSCWTYRSKEGLVCESSL